MGWTRFLESAAAVSLQAACIVAVAHWSGRAVVSERLRSRIWTLCYILLLAVVLTAGLLPHPRILPAWPQLDRPATADLAVLEANCARLIFWIWLGGCAVSLILTVCQTVRVASFLKTCQPLQFTRMTRPDRSTDAVPTPDPEDELTDPAAKDCLDVAESVSVARRSASGNYRPVVFLTSNAVSSPFCWQFHRPYIVVPEYVLRLTPREMQYILKHELAHLRTGHPLQLFLQRIVEVVFWFHPTVWWASQQAARTREFACDDAAINEPSEVAGYLRTLLHVVEQETSHAGCTTSLTFGRGRGTVAERARRLAIRVRCGSDPHPRTGGFVKAAATLCAATVAATAIWLPIDVLASTRSSWSPWPTWSAKVLHDLGVPARDFETYDRRVASDILIEATHGTRQVHAPATRKSPTQ